jgi:hypothetical protein
MHISIRQMNIYFANFEKLKSFVEISTPYNQILILEDQLGMSNLDIIF